jgi:hypothetical protein
VHQHISPLPCALPRLCVNTPCFGCRLATMYGCALPVSILTAANCCPTEEAPAPLLLQEYTLFQSSPWLVKSRPCHQQRVLPEQCAPSPVALKPMMHTHCLLPSCCCLARYACSSSGARLVQPTCIWAHGSLHTTLSKWGGRSSSCSTRSLAAGTYTYGCK